MKRLLWCAVGFTLCAASGARAQSTHCTIAGESDCTDPSYPYVVRIDGDDFGNLCHTIDDAADIIRTLTSLGQCAGAPQARRIVAAESACSDPSYLYVIRVDGQDFDNVCHELDDAVHVIATLKSIGQC